jgi:hypothetical protein
MSRHSISRSAKREKQKTLRALIALGLTSSAFAAVAATLVWAWSPNGGNWILSPQQDFAESGKTPAAGKGHAWVPPEVPPVTPWATIPTSADTSVAGNQISGETTQIASVDTKDGNSSGHGPMDYGSQNEGGGNVDHLFGLFSSGGNGNPNGGGQGTSWNGTFNPNFSRGYGGGGGGGGGGGAGGGYYPPGVGGGDDVCKGPDAQKFEKCKTTTTPPTPPTITRLISDPDPKDETSTGDNGQHGCGTGKHWSETAAECVADIDETQPQESNDQNNQTDPTPHECGTGEHWDSASAICVADGQPNPGNIGGAGGEVLINDPLAPIPEPGSLLMFSVALLGLGWFVRRRA